MDYYELNFTYNSETEPSVIGDVLAAELGGIGFDSFVENELGLSAYIPEKLFNEPELKEKLAEFPLDGVEFHYTAKRIKDQNWNEEWEKNYFQPITINHDCRIRASFHPDEEGYKYNITIDPRMAFGTGNHSTTYLMICEILKLDLEGKDVLDMGCGTAVLAILSRMKGASRVVAIDIDEWAYNNALENIRLNNTDDILVALGGAEKISEYGLFDVILANINRNILLKDIHVYKAHLRKGGLLFMSGFYKEDIPAIEAECRKNQLELVTYAEQNNWAAVGVKS